MFRTSLRENRCLSCYYFRSRKDIMREYYRVLETVAGQITNFGIDFRHQGTTECSFTIL